MKDINVSMIGVMGKRILLTYIILNCYIEMREPPYYVGYGHFRLVIHGMVTGKYFDVVIAAVIGLNVITMSLEYFRMPLVRYRNIIVIQ